MIKIRETDTQKVYFTSDLHLGHNRDFVFKNRGHSSVDEHNKYVIDTLNQIVAPNDILINMGDFCLNSPLVAFKDYITNIKCQNIYMLFGNHPNTHYKDIYVPMVKNILGDKYTESSEVYPLRYQNVVYYGHHQNAIVNGQFMVLNHYPIYVWENMQHGAWMLCGHSHHGCEFSVPKNTTNKILDVGWDGYLKPLSFKEISDIMSTKKVIANDTHHTPKNI